VQSPKIRAFVDFLAERLTFDADAMQTLCPDRRRCTEIEAGAVALPQVERAPDTVAA
jgi:hypothetical protein